MTLKLLNSFEIKKPMISYHEHNRFEMSPRIVARLLNGESCVLVTDAGMPAISDPGEDLVRMCHEHGIKSSPCRVPPLLRLLWRYRVCPRVGLPLRAF